MPAWAKTSPVARVDDGGADTASAVLSLLDDPAHMASLTRRAVVTKHCGWDRARWSILRVCEEATGRGLGVTVAMTGSGL